MFGAIALSNRSIDECLSTVGEDAAEALRHLAAPLAGRHVLHLTSPAASGAARSMLSHHLARYLEVLRQLPARRTRSAA